MDFTNWGRAIDPVLLMRDAGMEPDPWQARVLRSQSDRIMICCPRQSGKSEVTAFKALHHAMTVDDSLTLLVSRSQEQADGLFRKITSAYDKLGQPMETVRRMADRISFKNRSMIVALPNNPETVRFWSAPTLLILDEASRVSQDMVTAVYPMILASRGSVLLLSTPAGRSNWFYDRWSDPHGRWEKFAVKAADVKRFDLSRSSRKSAGSLARCERLRSWMESS